MLKFIQMYQDYEIIDARFTVEQVVNLVRHIFRADESQDIFDFELDLGQYQELLLATACFKTPDPYLSMEQRIEAFFQSTSMMMD